MTKLEQLRKEIDSIDHEIFELLERRFECTDAVGRYKKAHHLDIFNPKREEEILQKIADRFDSEIAPSIQEIYQILMEISKKHQRML